MVHSSFQIPHVKLHNDHSSVHWCWIINKRDTGGGRRWEEGGEDEDMVYKEEEELEWSMGGGLEWGRGVEM